VWKRLLGECARRKPRLAILTDFPGFHLRLARALKRRASKRLFCVPSILGLAAMAGEPGAPAVRARALHFPVRTRMVSLARRAGGFHWASPGGKLTARRSRGEFAASLGLDAAKPIVALLPGSRAGEIAHHVPPLMQACHLIAKSHPVQFVLAIAPGMSKAEIAGFLKSDVPVHVVEDATYDALARRI